MSRIEIDALRLGRRKFLQLGVGSLAFATVGCGQRRHETRTKHSTITILNENDEWELSPQWDDPPKLLVFLPLVSRNAKGEFVGRLAESWEHSPDYRTWTVHLRQGVRWHDGVPVTAGDVKFTMDLYMHPAVLAVPPGAYSVTVLDDRTYSVTYHRRVIGRGSPADDDYTTYYPKHLLEKLEPKEFNNWGFWTHPVGNGPYRYVRHVPKTMMELEANPDYYQGKPKIERVVLKFGDPSAPEAATELLSGNVDVIPYLNRMDLPMLRGDPRFRVYEAMYRELDMWIMGLFWNHRSPTFRDPKVRRALTLAINRRELHQVLNLPENTPLFDVIFTERQFRRRELPPPLPYDPELAKRLLDEAGWRGQRGNGLRERDGRQFRFNVLAVPGDGADKASVYIQAALRRVGGRTDASVLEWESLDRRVRAGDFDAAILEMNLAVSRLFFGESEISDVGKAFSYELSQGSPIGYANPKVMALLKELRVTFNPFEEDRIYRALWPIFQADVPVTFLYPLLKPTVAHRRVRGLSSPWRADPVWHMEDIWLDERGQR